MQAGHAQQGMMNQVGGPSHGRGGTEPGKIKEKAVRLTYDRNSKTWIRTPVTVSLAKMPFDQGGTRLVYKMQELDEQGNVIQDCVAKFLDQMRFMQQGIGPITKQMYFDDAMTQIVAQHYAELFSQKNPPKGVRFLDAWVLELVSRPGKPLCNVEPLLKGAYCKHNNNDGATFSARHTPQAFSHFTYEASKHKLLVCDIQGVDDHYTDPQVHTRSGKGFGLGNQGLLGFQKFLASHTCNPLCQMVGLPRLRRGMPVPNAPKAKQPLVPAQSEPSEPRQPMHDFKRTQGGENQRHDNAANIQMGRAQQRQMDRADLRVSQSQDMRVSQSENNPVPVAYNPLPATNLYEVVNSDGGVVGVQYSNNGLVKGHFPTESSYDGPAYAAQHAPQQQWGGHQGYYQGNSSDVYADVYPAAPTAPPYAPPPQQAPVPQAYEWSSEPSPSPRDNFHNWDAHTPSSAKGYSGGQWGQTAKPVHVVTGHQQPQGQAVVLPDGDVGMYC